MPRRIYPGLTREIQRQRQLLGGGYSHLSTAIMKSLSGLQELAAGMAVQAADYDTEDEYRFWLAIGGDLFDLIEKYR